jgi:hypothetical protein
MPAPTDYHALCRDAVAEALAGLDLGVPVHALDDLDVPTLPSLPFIGVVCVGPEQDRPEWASNVSDGLGLPVAVGLFGVGVVGGEKSPGTTDLTLFRRRVHVTFHNKRLTGVAEVGYCEVNGNSRIWDPQDPKFQAISTELVVTAVGRFPRS